MKPKALFLLLTLLSGCTGGPRTTPNTSSKRPDVPGLRQRAQLLLLADRRIYESLTVVEVATQSDLATREALVVALGQIGDQRARAELETMLASPQQRLSSAAAFSLGQLGLDESWAALTKAVEGSDLETAVWSIDALARSGADLADLLASVQEMELQDLWPRLLPYLFRFPPAQSFGLARQALGLAPDRAQPMAAYALARNPTPAGAALLRPLLGDDNSWVRSWAARALGQVGSSSDLELMRPLLDDESGAVIQALRAARDLIDSGRAAPPDSWRVRLLELMGDKHPGVAVTAIDASGSWLLDESIASALMRIADSGRRGFDEVAMMALIRGGDPRGRDLVYRFARSPQLRLRRGAAAGATVAKDRSLLGELWEDPSAAVRAAALTTILKAGMEEATSMAREALEDSDPVVVGTAFGWLIENPVVTTEILSRALIRPEVDDLIEVRLDGTRALVARGLSEPLERGLVVRNLETLAQIGDFPARRAAADGLAELGRDRPAIGPADTKRSISMYEDILLMMDRSRQVEITTEQGSIRLELQCPTTPLTCLSFLQLTNQGFFDGLVFHRVVPDFVVQGGDPRGDGWGGPGYTIRDELNRLPFDRGVIGMASAGADTAGSQFFITLSRQPHLDGLYTAFGRVVEGDDRLDAIVQGDRILSVRELH